MSSAAGRAEAAGADDGHHAAAEGARRQVQEDLGRKAARGQDQVSRGRDSVGLSMSNAMQLFCLIL